MFLYVNAIATSAVLAGGIGQFAFNHEHRLQTLHVSPSKFSVIGQDGLVFETGSQREAISIHRLSRYEKVISMRPKSGSPNRIVFETTSLGFSMEYRDGFRIVGVGAESPVLTWKEGSVGPGVPSAPSRWLLLTWNSKHAPLLLCFPDSEVSVIAHPTEQGFELKSMSTYTGWVRVRTPYGTRPIEVPMDPSVLGEMATEVAPWAEAWMSPAPKLLSATTTFENHILSVKWKFDREGAVVPSACFAAKNGSWMKISSPTIPCGVTSSSSYKQIVGDELHIRFFVSPNDSGIPVTSVRSLQEWPAHDQDTDITTVRDVVLRMICDTPPSSQIIYLMNQMIRLENQMPIYTDALTQSKIRATPKGKGWYEFAVNAFANTAIFNNQTSLEQLLSAVDWVTWLPLYASNDDLAGVSSLASFAATFTKNPETLALGAMLHAALLANHAERAPLHTARTWVYPPSGLLSSQHPAWYSAMKSAIHVVPFSGIELSVHEFLQVRGTDFKTFEVKFDIITQNEIEIEKTSNLVSYQIIQQTDTKPFAAKVFNTGDWVVQFKLLHGIPTLPKGDRGPRYNATQR